MKSKSGIKYQYYKTKKERYDHLGNRYFRVDFHEDHCLQICLSCGDMKKGRANAFGTYLIAKLTFFSNYMAQCYVEPCTKGEFDKKFELMIKMLR